MPQEYINLDDAAQMLGISREELIRMAQQREIRAFADRGTWKLRKKDVEEYARQRGIGSGAEIALGDQDEQEAGAPDQVTIAGADQAEEAVEILPSDSDVRLVPDEPADQPSDSDVKLVDEPKPPSDSDVRLAPESEVALSDSSDEVKVAGPAPSDSDVRLEEAEPPSDSGERLVSDTSAPGTGTAAEVTQDLPVLPDEELEGSSEELAIPGSSSELAATAEFDSDFELDLDATGSSDEVSLVPDEDQVQLAPADEEEDVTGKEPGASGIDLASPADSGIALETGETAGAQAAAAAVDELESVEELGEQKTEFEATEVDSDFELSAESASDTAQLSLDSDFELAGAEFDTGQSSDSGEVLELADAEPADDSAETQLAGGESGAVLTLEGEEEVGEGEATALAEVAEEEWAEELEAVGEVEEAEAVAEEFEEAAALEEAEAVEAEAVPAPTLPRAVAEPQWGAGWVITLGFCAVLMLLTTVVMIDLVRTMWGWPEGTSLYSSPLLNALASIWQ